MRKLQYGFYCSLHTLIVPILHIPLFALVTLIADSLVLGECCSSLEKNKVELGLRSCAASMNCFVVKWVNYWLIKRLWEACRATILADRPDLTQLHLLAAFSPMAIMYCLKLLWSSSQEAAIKVIILKDKLRQKRKKAKRIRQWWRLTSFHQGFIVILTFIRVLHFNFCLRRKKAIAFPFWT